MYKTNIQAMTKANLGKDVYKRQHYMSLFILHALTYVLTTEFHFLIVLLEKF